MAQEITLPVKLLIENLLAILKDMRSLLSTLKVDSSGYRKLEGVINGIEKKIQDIQVIASRPIMNGKQFSAVEKDISHIYDDITKLGMEAGKIKFSDLALTGDLKLKLLEFDNLLKTIKNDLKNIELSAKTAFLSSDAGKLWQELNPELATKSFLKITEIIDSEVAKLRLIINDAKTAYLDYNNTILVSKNINSFMRGKDSLADKIKAAGMFDKIFNSKGNFKSGGRNALEDWLKSEFSLSDDAIKQITQGSGQLVLAAFTEMKDNVRAVLKSEQSRLSANRKNAIDATNGGKTLTDRIASEEAKQLALVSAQSAVIKSKEASIEAENNLRSAEEATKNARSEYILSLTNLARAHLLMSNSCESAKALLANLNKIVDEGKNKLAKLDLASSKLSGISNFVNRYVGAYAIIRKVSTAIRNAFNNIKELDKTITSIAVVTNMSQQDLWNKVGQYTLMAQEYGVTTNDVYKVSQLFYQQGLLTNLVMSLTTETLKMAKIAGMDYTAATNAMTVAVRAFNIEMSLAQQVTDTYSALAAKFAVSSAEIANAMEKTASSAANVGMSLLSTSAFMSVMIQTTRESAQNIGSALKSIISRYGEMKASPDSLINVDGEVAAFNKVDTALLSIGISIKDSAGQFRNFDDVIMELAAKWDTLDNNTQRYVATVMAGNRQQSRFIALVSNYGELSRAMDVANNAENASIVQVAKTMDSLESKTNQLKNAFSQLYLDLHIESGLKNAYDWITRIITTLGKLGTLNGVLPTLANLFGFGTGLKSTVKAAQNSIEAKKLKIETDNSQYEKEIEKVKNDLSLPYELKITANVDDSLLLAAKNEIMLMNNPAMAAAASSATGKFALLGNIAGLDNNARLATLMGALNAGKLSTEALRKEFLTKDMHVDEESPIFNDLMLALEKLANSANLASGSLDTLDKKSDGTSKGVDNLGKTSETTGALTLKTGQDMSNAGSDARDAGNKFKDAGDRMGEGNKDWKSGITKGAMIFSAASRLLGTAITALGAAHEDKSTDSIEASKLYTGIGNGLSMAGTGTQLGMMTGQWWGPIAGALAGFLVGGVGAIIDGLHMSLEERLALEKAEAKKASDESLKVQAKTTDISNQLDNIKQLLKAMYNSTEDMQAYKDAMNTVASLYPTLISAYDEAGNAIVDLLSAEEYLASVRMEGSRLAREAAVAEAKTRKTLIEILDNFDAEMDDMITGGKNMVDKTGYDKTFSAFLILSTRGENALYYAVVGNSSERELDGTGYFNTNNSATEFNNIFKALLEKNSITGNEQVNQTLEYYRDHPDEIISADDFKTIGQYILDNTTYVLDEYGQLRANSTAYGTGVSWTIDDIDKFIKFINLDVTASENQYDFSDASEFIGKIDKFLSDNGDTLGIPVKTAKEYFTEWDWENGVSITEVQEGWRKLQALSESYNKLAKILNEQVTRAYAQEELDIAVNTKENNVTATRGTKLSTSGIFTSLITNGLEAAAEDAGFDDAAAWADSEVGKNDFIEKKKELSLAIINWTNTLTDKQVESFVKVTSSMDSYLSVDEILNDKQFKLSGADESVIAEIILEFTDANEANRNRILNTVYDTDGNFNVEALGNIELLILNDKETGLTAGNEYAELIADLFKERDGTSSIISKYADYFTSLLLDIDNLAELGYRNLAGNRLNILTDMANALKDIDDSQILLDLFNTITTIDFTDFDGLVKVLKALEEYRQKNNILDSDDGTAKILQSIIDAQELLIFNINTLSQSITEKITNAAKNIDSIISTNKSGLSLDKALEEYENLSVKLKDTNFNQLFLYDATLDKYVYTSDGLVAAIEQQETDLNTNLEKLIRTKEQYVNSLTAILNTSVLRQVPYAKFTEKTSLMNALSDVSKEYSTVVEKLINDFFSINKDGGTLEEFYNYIEELIQLGNKEAAAAEEVVAAYRLNKKNQYFLAIDWSSLALGTDYYGTNKTLVDALAKELGLEAEYTTELVLNKYLETILDSNLRALTAEKINSSIIQTRTSQYQTAISELLTYNTDKYLSVATQQVLSTVGTSLGDIQSSADGAIYAATKFLKALADLIGQAGYTLEQYNQDANSILERVLSELTQGKALLDFASEDKIGASQLEGLANSLHIQLDQLVDIESGIILGNIGKYLSFNTTTGSYEMYGSFDNFIRELEKLFGITIDKTSLEYIDAFKASNLARIKKHDVHKTDKAVSEEVNSIVSAKAGDSLDLTETWVAIEKFEKADMLNLVRKLSSLGAQFTDGILTIVDDTNIPAIISAIAVEALNAGILIPELIAQLNDALAEALNKITGLLKTGISGGLSNTDKLSLENWASLNGVTDLTFTKTAEGYKLAYDSAIKVYNVIKGIDALLGEVVFNELKDNLIESNEHFKTVQDLMEHIKDLLAKIANTDKYSPEKINLYKLELELSERILAVRSAAEEDASFNFMSNSIPAALNNPLNWFSNWQEGYQALNASRKSGYMDYTTFYNLFTEMGHLAEQSGEIPIGAGKTLKNMLDAQDLIEQAAGTLHVNAATGKLEVSFKELAELGIDFGKAGGEMDQSITKGMKEFAHAQVTMLDGLIKMLETIVLMEDLKNIGDGDGTLNIGEIFPKIEAGSFELDPEVLKLISDYLDSNSGKYISWLKDVTLGEQTLELLFSDAANSAIKDKAEAEKFYAVLKSFHDMNVSLDWTGGEDTLAEMARYFNENGIVNQELNWNGLTVMIGEGEMIPTITNPKTGKEEYQWTTNAGQLQRGTATEYYISRKKDALKALQDNALQGKVEIDKSGNSARILLLDREPIAVKIDKNGKFEYNGQQYDTLNQIFTAYLGAGITAGSETLTTVEQLEIAAGLKIMPKITDNPKLTTEQIESLKNSTAELLRKEFQDKPIESQAKYGIKLDKTTTDEALLTWLNSLDEKVTLGANTDPIVQAVNDLTLPDKYINIYGIYKGEKVTSDTTTINHKKNAWIKSGGEVTLASAMGNANARGTLLGELGPELVVSNGRYFVAGQNGAEMINLTDDAIVFNHLQTKSLLEKGMSNGRGKAITNERNAVSYAKGSVNGGPAKASASSALTALRQLKALWEAIEKLSAKDLVGKGGGGGGGGKDANFIKDLERWYNWLQEIAKLEKKINYEESLRSKMLSDFNRNGKDYYNSLKDTLEYLEREKLILQDLVKELTAFFNKRRNELNAQSAFSELYTFDEEGQIKYKTDKFELLTEMFGNDSVTGKANHSVQEQYDYLISQGYGYAMQYKDDGSEIKVKNAKDTENMVTAIEAFWSKIDVDLNEMLNLYDSIEEGLKSILEHIQKQNEILHLIEDNLISVENRVLKALEDSIKREIDELSKQKDAIEKSSTALIDGLSKSLEKERSMYLNQLNKSDLESKRRLLAILLRSGGSAAEIRSLQDQINSASQEEYFNKQQEQIDALQEASDTQIEKMQEQIDIMNESLEYQKEHGLLWERVYEVMNLSPKDIADYIQKNDSEYWGQSPTDLGKNMRDVLFEAELYKAYAENGVEVKDLVTLIADEIVEERKIEKEKQQAALTETTTSTTTSSSSNNNNNSKSKTSNKDKSKEKWEWNGKTYNSEKEALDARYAAALKALNDGMSLQGVSDYGYTMAKRQYNLIIAMKPKKIETKEFGGMVEHTGMELVHAKEGVLTPEQTSILRNEILGNDRNSLLNLLQDFRATYSNIANNSTYNTSSEATIIEHAEVNMHVGQLANSYDSARAADDVMKEMLNIARKTNAQNRIGR